MLNKRIIIKKVFWNAATNPYQNLWSRGKRNVNWKIHWTLKFTSLKFSMKNWMQKYLTNFLCFELAMNCDEFIEFHRRLCWYFFIVYSNRFNHCNSLQFIAIRIFCQDVILLSRQILCKQQPLKLSVQSFFQFSAASTIRSIKIDHEKF